MKSILLMITFFTRIPVRYNYEYDEKDFIRGIRFLPLIGLIIGAIMYIPALFQNVIHDPIIVLLTWVIYIGITGGLHIDGLADTFDGLFSNRDKEKILEIMKDSRIGTFGVIGLFLLMVWNLVFTNYIDLKFIILVPVVGRSAAILSASICKYAREGQGMGKAFVENCGVSEAVWAVIFSYILMIQFLKLQALIILTIIYLAVLIATENIKRKIGGMTGDTIGFIIEFSQGISIFVLYLFNILIS